MSRFAAHSVASIALRVGVVASFGIATRHGLAESLATPERDAAPPA